MALQENPQSVPEPFRKALDEIINSTPEFNIFFDSVPRTKLPRPEQLQPSNEEIGILKMETAKNFFEIHFSALPVTHDPATDAALFFDDFSALGHDSINSSSKIEYSDALRYAMLQKSTAQALLTMNHDTNDRLKYLGPINEWKEKFDIAQHAQTLDARRRKLNK